MRFSEIDVNGDGIKDLFAFEKNGNRILIFINNGEKNCINYKYAPEYAHFFPKMHDWVILKDYNQDGKEDIFTYGNAGITVYKNVSDGRFFLIQFPNRIDVTKARAKKDVVWPEGKEYQ